jgi:putative ABC transport system substrate-binding protein
MKRREFITFLAGAAAAWPISGCGQQAAMPVIGFLSGRSPTEMAATVGAFRRGLGETGYIEGKNVTIEYRWAEGRYDRLRALAAELVGRQVAVIAATGGEASGLAAKAATTTIPIVFTGGGDPVELGLVASLSHPGGNVTGVTFIVVDSATKRLGLLRHLAPGAIAIAMLINPNFPSTAVEAAAVQVGARSLGLQVKLLYAGTSSEIDAAFATFVLERPDALLLGGDPFLLGQRDHRVAGGALRRSDDLSAARVRRCWRPDELWKQHPRSLSTGWRLYRPNSEWHQARRVTSVAADQVRAGDKPQDREGTWPDNSAWSAAIADEVIE